MFERLLEQRWAISAVSSDRVFTKLSDARTLELTDDSWELWRNSYPCFAHLNVQPLHCGESGVSISMVYPVTATLLSKHLKVIPGESPKVSQFKQTVSTSLERRLAPADVSSACKVAFIASFLDPRHKHLRFATEEVQCRPRCVISSKIKDHQAVFDLIKNSSESEEEMGLTVERDETQRWPKSQKVIRCLHLQSQSCLVRTIT